MADRRTSSSKQSEELDRQQEEDQNQGGAETRQLWSELLLHLKTPRWTHISKSLSSDLRHYRTVLPTKLYWTYDSPSLRNLLVHNAYSITSVLLADQVKLSEDQEEISEDLRIAVLRLLAKDRPDLLLSAVLEIMGHESTTDVTSRTYKLLVQILREALERSHSQAADSSDDAT